MPPSPHRLHLSKPRKSYSQSMHPAPGRRSYASALWISERHTSMVCRSERSTCRSQKNSVFIQGLSLVRSGAFTAPATPGRYGKTVTPKSLKPVASSQVHPTHAFSIMQPETYQLWCMVMTSLHWAATRIWTGTRQNLPSPSNSRFEGALEKAAQVLSKSASSIGS